MKRILALTLMLAFMLATVGIAQVAERAEIVSMRTQYYKVYRNANGSYTAEIHTVPIHKKNAAGEWVDAEKKDWDSPLPFPGLPQFGGPKNGDGKSNGVAKAAYDEELDTENCYCCDHDDQYVYPGYRYVGRVYEDDPYPEWRTAYRWSTGGLPPMEVSSAFYQIKGWTYFDSLYVAYVSCDPKYADHHTLWQDCGDDYRLTLTGVSYLNFKDVIFSPTMINDLETVLSEVTGYFAMGHFSPVSGLQQISADAVLYINWDSLLKKDIAGKESVESISASPNPFNPSTQIHFTLKESAQIKLNVYSSTGQLVKTLINNYLQPGKHSAMFNGIELASGIYFYLLTTPKESFRGKMVLVK
jgi:hypothetical protein